MSLRATLRCPDCNGEGNVTSTKLTCSACHGSGNLQCDVRGCKADAVGFSEDGTAMCEDCLGEWIGQVEQESGLSTGEKR